MAKKSSLNIFLPHIFLPNVLPRFRSQDIQIITEHELHSVRRVSVHITNLREKQGRKIDGRKIESEYFSAPTYSCQTCFLGSVRRTFK